MAVAYNNQKVPTDGLVLYYDMHNPKSWRGKPTENLFTNPSFSSGDLTGWGLGNNHGTYHETTIDPSSYRRDGYSAKVSVVALGGSSSGHHYAMNRTLSTTNNSTVSVSAYIKGRPGTISLLRVTRIVDGAYQWSGGVSGDVNGNMTSTGEWQKLTTTLSEWTGAGTTSGIHVRIGFNVNVELTVGDFCNIDECQFEFGEYPTPFVTGERTTTQVVLDLTKNGTITAADLTYSSENTFSFTKNTDRLSFPNPIVSSSPHTIIQWVRADPALPDQTHSNYRVTPMVGPSPTWNPGYWLTARVFRVHASTEYRDYTINWVSDTSWHMIGQVFDGTNVRHIIDGNVFLGTRTAYSPPAQTTIYIGAETVAGSAASWKGDLPAIMFYNRQLSDSEVRDAFEATRHRYGI